MRGCRKIGNSSSTTIGNAKMNRIRQEEMQRRWRPSLLSPRHFIIIGANEPIGHIACLAALPPIISTRFSMSGAALTAIFVATRAYCIDGIQKWCSVYKPSSYIRPNLLYLSESFHAHYKFYDIHICLCTARTWNISQFNFLLYTNQSVWFLVIVILLLPMLELVHMYLKLV